MENKFIVKGAEAPKAPPKPLKRSLSEVGLFSLSRGLKEQEGFVQQHEATIETMKTVIDTQSEALQTAIARLEEQNDIISDLNETINLIINS